MIEFVIKRMPPDELCHWGIKGQKWGIRRYQNEDGTLTPEGEKRYNNGVLDQRMERKMQSIDRSAERGRKLAERNKASIPKKIAKSIGIDMAISLIGHTAINAGANRKLVTAGSLALSTVNWGMTISDIRDIKNYRNRNNANKPSE